MTICSSGGQTHDATFSNQQQHIVASIKTLKVIRIEIITWHLTLSCLSASRWIVDIWRQTQVVDDCNFTQAELTKRPGRRVPTHGAHRARDVRSQEVKPAPQRQSEHNHWAERGPTIKINETTHWHKKGARLSCWALYVGSSSILLQMGRL